jgi:hypothetical protein
VAKNEVVDKDAKWTALIKSMKSAAGEASAYVGVTGDTALKDHTDGEGHPIGITNAELATIHEFGLDFVKVTRDASGGAHAEHIHLDERPFIRPATDENQAKYFKMGQKLSEKVIDGTMTVEQLLGVMGATAAADVQKYIASNKVKPPSSAETNKRKKSSVTLVDHGILKASITWRVGYGDRQMAVKETPAKPSGPATGELTVFDLFKAFDKGEGG